MADCGSGYESIKFGSGNDLSCDQSLWVEFQE